METLRSRLKPFFESLNGHPVIESAVALIYTHRLSFRGALKTSLRAGVTIHIMTFIIAMAFFLMFSCTDARNVDAKSEDQNLEPNLPPSDLVLQDTYISTAPASSSIKGINSFIGKFREAYRTDAFGGLFMPDFRYVETDGRAHGTVLKRDEFIRTRSLMFAPDYPPDIQTNIRAADVNGETAVVQLVQQYRGRVFAPVLGEKFRLRRSENGWMADLMASTPVFTYPDGSPLEPPARIFLVSDHAELSKALESPTEFENYIQTRGVPAFENLLLENNRDTITGDERPFNVVFAFETPPKPGSEIRIEHQFWRPWAQNLPPYVFRYLAQGTGPYVIFTNTSQAGGSDGTISYRIFVNDTLVGEKKVRIL